MRAVRTLLSTMVVALVGCAGEPREPAAHSGPGGSVHADAEPDPTLVVHDLGSWRLGERVPFDVPRGALGVTVVARATGELGFETAESPEGTRVIDAFGFDGLRRYTSADPFLRTAPTATVLAAAFPQSDSALQLPAGRWTLTLGPDGRELPPDEAHLTLWVRQGAGQFTGGQIDVNLFVPPGVATEGYLVETLERALSSFAGMTLGVVTTYPLGESAAVVDDEEEYVALLERTRIAARSPAVNAVAAADMSGLIGAPIGKAPGIPGLGAEHGTELSGIVFEASGDIELDASVVRHEMGHLAGLYHTSDAYGFDPLSDTPECGDIDGDTACPDATNLMFPRSNGSNVGADGVRVRRGVGGHPARARHGERTPRSSSQSCAQCTARGPCDGASGCLMR